MSKCIKQAKWAGAVAAALAISNLSWAITPDGGGSRSSGAEVPPMHSHVAPPVAHSSESQSSKGLPILQNPSAAEIKKALGIGRSGTKSLEDLEDAGFGSFIEFETDSTTVIPSRGLEVIADALSDLEPGVAIQITGHTDSMGDDEYNMRLSWDRADAVRRWLENHGVRPGVIKVKGVGSHYPIASNNTEEGRRQNRRVEFSRIYD